MSFRSEKAHAALYAIILDPLRSNRRVCGSRLAIHRLPAGSIGRRNTGLNLSAGVSNCKVLSGLLAATLDGLVKETGNSCFSGPPRERGCSGKTHGPAPRAGRRQQEILSPGIDGGVKWVELSIEADPI
jgi:hypothetical protein